MAWTLIGGLVLAVAALSLVLGPPPSGEPTYLQGLAEHATPASLTFILFAAADVLMVPALLALYPELAPAGRTASVVGSGLIGLWALQDLVLTEATSLALVGLARHYAAATGDARQAILLAAQYPLAVLPVATFLSYVVSSAGLLLVGAVMLRSAFPRGVALLALIAAGEGLVGGFYVLAPVLSVLLVPSLVTFGLWSLLVGAGFARRGGTAQERPPGWRPRAERRGGSARCTVPTVERGKRMPFAKVDAAELYYEIHGTGPDLLFINGIGADLTNPMGAFTSPLPEHFTVLAYDPRGLGRSVSGRPLDSIPAMADDAAALADRVGWRRYHVFGASMGGMVAQELALRHPEAVDKLVLGVTNPGGRYAGHVGAHQIRALATPAKLRAADTRQDDAWMRANPDAVRRAEERYRATWDALEADPAALRAYRAQVEAAEAHDTVDRLGAIRAPTLVFGGRFDGSCSPEITAALAERIPGARFELFDAGHGNWFADRHAWDVILAFLTG